MTWWQWLFIGTGAIAWLAVAMFLLALALDPGKGWSLSCMYGGWWRRAHGQPDEGPECGYHLTPRWYWPEWTKRIRFWVHWNTKHHGAPRVASRSD